MSRISGAALVAALIVVGLLAGISPVHAADRDGAPVIVAPARASAVDSGWQGTVVVDFSNASVGQYTVALFDAYDGAGHGSWVETFDSAGSVAVDESTTVVELPLTEPLVKPGTYLVNVADAHGNRWASAFHVFPPAGGDERPLVDPIEDVEIGKRTTIQVDLSGARIGKWQVELCTNITRTNSQCQQVTTLDNTQSTTVVPVTIPAVSRQGVAAVHVFHAEESVPRFGASRRFEVIAPLTLTDLRAVPAKFFPTVRDGFRDRTVIRYGTRYNQVITYARLRIFDGDRRVHTDELNQRGAFRWDGRDSRGRLVPTGRYRVEVFARTEHGHADTARTVVEVARRTVHDSGTLERRGTDTTSRSKSPSCYVRRYSGELTLDCWGGRQAVATYAFRVPKDASRFDFDVRGSVNCCEDGVLSRTGRKVSDRRYVVTVRVTDWRSFTVRRVDLRWHSYTQQ